MNCTYTHNLDNPQWLDLHKDGRHHRMVTWQERMEIQNDGKLHMICHIFVNGNLNKAIADIPMPGKMTRHRLDHIFEALDNAGHPSDTDPALNLDKLTNQFIKEANELGTYDGIIAHMGHLTPDGNKFYITALNGDWNTTNIYIVNDDYGDIRITANDIATACRLLAEHVANNI